MQYAVEEAQLESLRRRRIVLRLAVGAAWAGGLLLAIRSGFVPGDWWDGRFWWDGRRWSYPVGHVLVATAQITLVSLCLYDFLRPQPEGSSLERTARATGLSLIAFLWVAINTWTDEPAYSSVAFRYVFIVTAVLVLGLVIQGAVAAVRALRGRGHAA